MSASSNPTTKLPSEFRCHECQTVLDMGMAVTKEAAERGLFKGHLIVCGHCGTFLVVGDSSLERLTVKQFKALNPEMQRLLGLTRKQIEKRNKQGGN